MDVAELELRQAIKGALLLAWRRMRKIHFSLGLEGNELSILLLLGNAYNRSLPLPEKGITEETVFPLEKLKSLLVKAKIIMETYHTKRAEIVQINSVISQIENFVKLTTSQT